MTALNCLRCGLAAVLVYSSALSAQQARTVVAPKGGAVPPDLDVKSRGPVRPVDLAAFPTSYHSEFVAGPASGFDGAYLMLTRVPPHFEGLPLHKHSSDQIYFVVSGEMTVQLGTEVLKAGANTLVFIPAGVPHRNWNVTDQQEVHAELIVPPPPRDALISPAEPSKIDKASALIRRVTDMPQMSQHGATMRWLARRSDGSQNAAISYNEVQPGFGETRLHIHRFDQVYFVLDGTMNLQLGLKKYLIKPNTYVIIPAGTVHREWNAGTTVQKHLTLLLPESDTVEQVHVRLVGKASSYKSGTD